MAVMATQLEGRLMSTGARIDTRVDSMSLVGPSDTIITPRSPTAPVRVAGTRSSDQMQDASGGAAAVGTSLTLPVRFPKILATPAEYAFDMRGQWEGTVTQISADEFSVVLRDIMNPGGEEYDAVFSIDEVADDDRGLLKEGAILYWTIGYEQRRGGRRRYSELRLRRLPAWSRADLARVERESRELDDLFAP